jgi:hypothetical protein
LPVTCVNGQEHIWQAYNNSHPTWKWPTFTDIVSPSLQFPDKDVHHAAVVGEEIQVGMKHVHF